MKPSSIGVFGTIAAISGTYVGVYERHLLPDLVTLFGTYYGSRLLCNYLANKYSLRFNNVVLALDSVVLYYTGSLSLGLAKHIIVATENNASFWVSCLLKALGYWCLSGAFFSLFLSAAQHWLYKIVVRTWVPMRNNIIQKVRLALIRRGLAPMTTDIADIDGLLQFLLNNRQQVLQALVNLQSTIHADTNAIALIDKLAPLRCKALQNSAIVAMDTDAEDTIDTDKCAVCLASFDADKLHRILPCRHAFDAACIDPWLQEHMNCPMCRAPLIEQ